MNDKKEKQTKSQVTFSILLLIVILFAEMYLILHFNDSFLVTVIALAAATLITCYILVDGIWKHLANKEAVRQEYYEKILRSEKASYLLMKKRFEEIEDQISALRSSQQNPALPIDDIINAQKAMAKSITRRNQESAEELLQEIGRAHV